LITTVEETTPFNFSLEQNYPNPFNPSTTISFNIPENSALGNAGSTVKNTSLEVYDILGKKVKTLFNEYLPPGTYKTNFNAESLVSGIYFYRLTQGNYTITKSMLLLK
jgi:hypothetical protein